MYYKKRSKRKDNRPECVKNAVKKAQRLVQRIFEDEMIIMLKDFDNRKEGLEYILNTFTQLRDNTRAVFAQLMVQKSMGPRNASAKCVIMKPKTANMKHL